MSPSCFWPRSSVALHNSEGVNKEGTGSCGALNAGAAVTVTQRHHSEQTAEVGSAPAAHWGARRVVTAPSPPPELNHEVRAPYATPTLARPT